MTVYAAGQRVASNPAQLINGVPTIPLIDGDTLGVQLATDCLVASAVFYVDTNGADTTVAQTTTTPALFAGVLRRSNSQNMPFGDSLAGFSPTISAGSNASVIVRSTVPVAIAAANESGSVPLIGSAVYAMTATGLFQTQTVGGSAPSGGVLTNFRVFRVPAGWSAGATVVISNKQSVGA